MKPTYASIYNRAYCKQQGLNAWLQRHLQFKRYAHAQTWVAHIHTLIETQRLGHGVDTQSRQMLLRQQRVCELARIFSARKLQAFLVRYLWRPGGPLFLRHAPRDMLLTPTRAAA